MEGHESTAVAITIVVSVTAIITKALDLLSAWLKYRTQLMQTPASSTAKDQPLATSAWRAFSTLLLPLWPAFASMAGFLSILLWYSWVPRPLTAGAFANIALCTGGFFFMLFFVFAAVVFQLFLQPLLKSPPNRALNRTTG